MIRLHEGQLHPKVAEDLNELGTVAYLQHNSAAAENYWQQSLPLLEKVLGPDHPDVGATLNNLARSPRRTAQVRGQLFRYSHTAQISTCRSGTIRTTTSPLYFQISRWRRTAWGARREAEALFQRALRAAVVHHHRLTGPIMVDLADLICRRGESCQIAEDLLKRATPIIKAEYPNDASGDGRGSTTRAARVCSGRTSAPQRNPSYPRVPRYYLRRWAPGTLYGYQVQRRHAVR